jgi:hypothetical protein
LDWNLQLGQEEGRKKELKSDKKVACPLLLLSGEKVLEEEEIFPFDGMSGVKPGEKSNR